VSVITVPIIAKPSGKINGIGNVFVMLFIIACCPANLNCTFYDEEPK
jgi:hypothetical protein